MNVDREDFGQNEINLLGTKYLLTINTPEVGPINLMFYLKEIGQFVTPIERNVVNGAIQGDIDTDWHNFPEISLEDYINGRWAASMALQTQEDMEGRSPMSVYWVPGRGGQQFRLHLITHNIWDLLNLRYAQDGAIHTDVHKVLNLETGEFFPVTGMGIKLPNGMIWMKPANRDGFWKFSSAGNGHTDLQYGITDNLNSLDARDGVLIYTPGECSEYLYYPGSSITSEVEACNLVGNNHIKIKLSNGDKKDIWVLND